MPLGDPIFLQDLNAVKDGFRKKAQELQQQRAVIEHYHLMLEQVPADPLGAHVKPNWTTRQRDLFICKTANCFHTVTGCSWATGIGLRAMSFVVSCLPSGCSGSRGAGGSCVTPQTLWVARLQLFGPYCHPDLGPETTHERLQPVV